MISNSLPNDAALRTRARRVIPGGMYGHLNVARLPPSYPQFFARAEGATLWESHVTAYVDCMCPYGPRVLGYGNREVEDAASAQRALGDVLTGPSERLGEVAGKTGGVGGHADWARCPRSGWSSWRRNWSAWWRTPTGRCSSETAPMPRRSAWWWRGRPRRNARSWRRAAPITARRHGARPIPAARPPRTACISCITTTTTWQAL